MEQKSLQGNAGGSENQEKKAGKQNGDTTKTDHIAYFPGLVDIVSSKGKPAFLDMFDDDLVITFEIYDRDGKKLTPPAKPHLPWLLPRAEEVQRYFDEAKGNTKQADAELFDDIVEYLRGISELPKEEYYHLLAAWVMHGYLFEHTDYFPMIYFYAIPERGKSRTGKGLIYLAWRGIHVESLRPAYLIRAADRLKASLFFDVVDLSKKAQKSDSEDILLLRFEKGATVGRVMYPDRGPFKDTEYFSVSGSTVIATNEPVNSILETRAIQITMREATRRFDNDVKPQNALPLKERLVAFRARHLEEPLPEMEKPTTGRLGDLLRPFQQIFRLVRPECEEGFLRFIPQIQAAKQLEKSELPETKILRAVLDCESRVMNGSLLIQVITDQVNEDTPERYRYTRQRVGKVLGSMGFQKTKLDHGIAAILWDEKLIEKLKQYFGL